MVPLDLKRGYLPFIHGVGYQIAFSDPVFMAKHGLQLGHASPAFPYDPDGINAIINSDDSSEDANQLRRRLLLLDEWLRKDINTGWFPTWKNLKFVRANWGRPLIIKGIMCVEDAEMALDAGCEGIVISYHGGLTSL